MVYASKSDFFNLMGSNTTKIPTVNSSNANSILSQGAIGGIAGAGGFVILALLVCIYCRCRSSKRDDNNDKSSGRGKSLTRPSGMDKSIYTANPLVAKSSTSMSSRVLFFQSSAN